MIDCSNCIHKYVCSDKCANDGCEGKCSHFSNMFNETFIKNIKEAIHQADLLLRPSALFINMHDEDAILMAVPDIEDRVALVKTNYVERGKAYLTDRKILEDVGNLEPSVICSSFSVFCSTCMNRYNCAESEYHQNGGCDHYKHRFESATIPSATVFLTGIEKDDFISRIALKNAVNEMKSVFSPTSSGSGYSDGAIEMAEDVIETVDNLEPVKITPLEAAKVLQKYCSEKNGCAKCIFEGALGCALDFIPEAYDLEDIENE